jgi:SAM-dependent methyltransferase
MPEPIPGALEATSPSAVGLTRLSARLSFPPGSAELYQSILRMADASPVSEILIVPSGRGRSARFVAEASGATVSGADPDPQMVAIATERAKLKGLGSRLHFDQAYLHDLPYQNDIFDLALGEIELAAARHPPGAVRELVRVTKPGGMIVLIQLVLLKGMAAERRQNIIEKLGIRPLMVVEWRQMLKEAGVEDVQVEDWSASSGWPRRLPVVGGLNQLFTVRGKLKMLPRAWSRWGWRGVKAVLSRERELRELLSRERAMGVMVIRGRVAAAANTEGEREEHGE